MRLSIETEIWPLAAPFRISRGSRNAAEVVVARLALDGVEGRGECVPYARYGETVASVVDQIRLADLDGLTPDAAGRDLLMRRMQAGAARNALDCALWDLEAKLTGIRAAKRAGCEVPPSFTTALTLSIDTPEAMAAEARARGDHSLLKLKLDAEQIVERVAAVREAAPNARLIVDANEAWTPALLAERDGALAELGIAAIEQPLPAQADAALAEFTGRVPLIADESCHTLADLSRLAAGYRGVNIKLDKAGGLTHALALSRAAHELGFMVMIGCMVATSLAMAPATLLAATAAFIDLDGPFLLREDRRPTLIGGNGRLTAPAPELWG